MQKSEGQNINLPQGQLPSFQKEQLLNSPGKPQLGTVYLLVSSSLKLIKNLVLIPVLFLLLVIMGALSSILVRNESRLSKLLTAPGRLTGLAKLCKAILTTTVTGVMRLLRTTLGGVEPQEGLDTPTRTRFYGPPWAGTKLRSPLRERSVTLDFLKSVVIFCIFLCVLVSMSWVFGINKSSDIAYVYLMTWLPLFLAIGFLYLFKEASK